MSSWCVGVVVLHAAGAWAVGADALGCLQHGDRAMVRWICSVRAGNEVGSDSLLVGLGIWDLGLVLRAGEVRWFGHVGRGAGWILGCPSLMWLHGGGGGGGGGDWVWALLALGVALSGEDVFEEDLSKSLTLGRGKRALKWI